MNGCVALAGEIAFNVRVLMSGREFEKLLLSNAGQALLAAILLLAAVRSEKSKLSKLII